MTIPFTDGREDERMTEVTFEATGTTEVEATARLQWKAGVLYQCFYIRKRNATDPRKIDEAYTEWRPVPKVEGE